MQQGLAQHQKTTESTANAARVRDPNARPECKMPSTARMTECVSCGVLGLLLRWDKHSHSSMQVKRRLQWRRETQRLPRLALWRSREIRWSGSMGS